MTATIADVLGGRARWCVVVADVLDGLRAMPDGSVQCCVCSPPYWGLRMYLPEGHPDKHHEIGLEPTPAAYLERMVAVFREVRRVLRTDGVCWVNLGDSYIGGGRGGGGSFADERPGWDDTPQGFGEKRSIAESNGLKPKDLCGMPWRIAFALQADGWWLRSDIIWAKPNPMPESVTDRPTKAHEYIFLLTKSARYFYDAEAVKEAATDTGRVNGGEGRRDEYDEPARLPPGSGPHRLAREDFTERGRNLRTVWTIPTQPFPEAHFATFPEAIPDRCIRAGTSERGCCPACGGPWERVVDGTPMILERSARTHPMGQTRCSGAMIEPPSARTLGWSATCKCPPHEPVPCVVLDPFAGSCTTIAVACRIGRRGIGIELNPDYAATGERRIGRACNPATFRSDEADPDTLFTPAPRHEQIRLEDR